jgi:protein phosphatase-4 regulatory subunit 3
MELPESKALDGEWQLLSLAHSAGPPAVPQGRAALINGMVDTLSYCLLVHGHRAQYYILSNPLAQKVCSLLYASDKTLRYGE